VNEKGGLQGVVPENKFRFVQVDCFKLKLYIERVIEMVMVARNVKI
jgi:hypothetical protein